MKKLLQHSFAFAVVLALAGTSVAQRHTGAAMGASARRGVSASSMHSGNAAASGGARTVAHAPTTTLANNTRLNSALTKALGKSGISVPGGDLASACGGFKNVGQCVAAMHVSKNLNLTGGFDALKNAMTGSTSESLGKAIQQLDPTADAKAAVKQANQETKRELEAVAKHG